MDDRETVEEKVARAFRLLDGTEPRPPGVQRLEAAEALFQDALSSDPTNYPGLIGLGRCYAYDPKKYVEAIQCFWSAADVCTDIPEPFYRLGRTFLSAGECGISLPGLVPFNEALQFFEAALQLGYQDRAEIHRCLGTTFFRSGRYEEAMDHFDAAAASVEEEGGWNPSIYFLAAQACEHLGWIADAIRWYQRYLPKGVGTDGHEINERIASLRALLDNGSETG